MSQNQKSEAASAPVEFNSAGVMIALGLGALYFVGKFLLGLVGINLGQAGANDSSWTLGAFVVLGLGFAAVAGMLLYGLLNFRHGLLDPRKKVRVDILGDVATREKDPTLAERFVSLMSIPRFGERFYAFALKQLGVDNEQEFGKEMLFRLQDAYKSDPSPLTRGDLKAEAERRWPYWKDERGEWQGQFELHLELPAHMEPTIIDNNKLITGEPISFLTYRLLSVDELKKAYGTALRRVQETASYVPAVSGLLGLGFVLVGFPLLSSLAQSQWLGFILALSAGASAAAGIAIWALTSLAEKALHVRSVAAFAHHKVNSDESLRTVTRALVRSKEAIKKPTGGLEELRNSLRMALRDKNPVMQLGTASGHALLHGVAPMHAFMEDQPVCLTTDDLSRGGVIILGATGSGKSYSILIPLMAQIMRAPFNQSDIAVATSSGLPLTASMVTFDPKAALHHDATALARDCGWIARNIGTGEKDFGLDLFDGLTPVIVSTIQSEAMAQKAGAGAAKGDPFWDSMGAKVRYAATVVARVYELTDKGLEQVEKTGERIYSFVGVYKLVMACRSSEGYLFNVVETIIRNIRDKELRKFIAPRCGPELIAAIDFLRRDLMTQFSEATVGGFIANVTDALADFVSENDIRERFGAARGNILDIDRLWDNRTVTNFTLSKYRYGDVARIVTIMAKIRLYHRAALRQEMDPNIGKRSKIVVVGDECQEFVTSGGTFSESQYINTSRAFGVSFIFATQTISALIMALGSEKAARNMMAQLRSKVILASEDPDNLSYVQSVVGKTLQSYIYEDGDHESLFTWRKELLGSISDDIRPEVTSKEDMLLQSHPLIHGRVEPLMRSSVDELGRSYAQSDTEAYEAMYVHGEDWVKAYSPQGRIAAFTQNMVRGAINPSNPGADDRKRMAEGLGLRDVYDNDDMKKSVGLAIVITNNQGLFKSDMVRLSHQLGFLQNKEGTTINVEAKEIAAPSAAEKVASQRASLAAQPALAK